jgi:pimeloyl-ACP methyl ester carboxylesterase/class 3 adenylate cyclase
LQEGKMADISEVRYARAADGIDIAYQTVGHGPIDLVFVSGFTSHLDLNWDFPWYNWPPQFDGFARVILFDKRGTGLSDRSLGFGSLADRSDDVRTVMDACGSEKAVLWGVSEGGPMTLLFAATYPQRVSSLIIYGSFAALSPDTPPENFTPIIEWMQENWGTGKAFGLVAQNAPNTEEAERLLARFERSACTRQMMGEILRRNMEIDVRSILPTISVPTLVLHNVHDPLVPFEHGRYLAEHIPGAKFVEGPGYFHASWIPSDMDWARAAISEFVGAPRPEQEPDRVLATVLFTDIVHSTERTATMGDHRWREVLDRHDLVAKAEVARHQGHLVNTTGDGVVATFDGPARGIRCAETIRKTVDGFGIGIRAGLHTGEVEMRGTDITGLGVVIARRICDLASDGELLASRTVKDLVTGSGIGFADRGAHALKGVPDEWQLYAVER